MSLDQLNAPNCSSVEQLVRRNIQLELAVERNPARPDYTGLGDLLAGSVEEKGRVSVPKFSKALGERHQQRAQHLLDSLSRLRPQGRHPQGGVRLQDLVPA